MPPTVESLPAAAFTLPPAARAELAERLWQSTPPDRPAPLHPDWPAELARRAADPEQDDIPWEDVDQEIQAVIAAADRQRAARGVA